MQPHVPVLPICLHPSVVPPKLTLSPMLTSSLSLSLACSTIPRRKFLLLLGIHYFELYLIFAFIYLHVRNALGSVTKTIKKENLSFLEAVDEGIEQVSDELPDDDDRVLPGFCITKGLQPILPLLLNGLMLGSPEQRELSAAVCYF